MLQLLMADKENGASVVDEPVSSSLKTSWDKRPLRWFKMSSLRFGTVDFWVLLWLCFEDQDATEENLISVIDSGNRAEVLLQCVTLVWRELEQISLSSFFLFTSSNDPASVLSSLYICCYGTPGIWAKHTQTQLSSVDAVRVVSSAQCQSERCHRHVVVTDVGLMLERETDTEKRQNCKFNPEMSKNRAPS